MHLGAGQEQVLFIYLFYFLLHQLSYSLSTFTKISSNQFYFIFHNF